VSYVEVLGYHQLSAEDQLVLEAFFAAATILPRDEPVLDQAVKLRQMRKISLGDALVAGTALAYDRILATRNVDHFKWIPGLKLINPFDGGTDTSV
jgi:toxin FitB